MGFLQHHSTLPVRDVQITWQNHRQEAGVARLKSEFWGMTLTPPPGGKEAAQSVVARLLEWSTQGAPEKVSVERSIACA